MPVKVLLGCLWSAVSVTVDAPLGTSIVRSDIRAFHAPAKLSLAPVFRDGKVQSEEPIEELVVDALSVADAERLQVEWFGTGDDLEPVIPADLADEFGEITYLSLLIMNICDYDVFSSL